MKKLSLALQCDTISFEGYNLKPKTATITQNCWIKLWTQT